MKTRLVSRLLVSGFVLGTAVVFAQIISPSDPPLDLGAIHKTHLPEVSAALGGGGGAGGPAQPATAATFSGTAYTVGQVVGPTTTIPEAEEHIAVAPSNSSSLVAAISDFALRGGYNTTKYVVSSGNGTRWTEQYVPADATTGFLTTSDGNVWYANSDPVVAIDKAGNVYLADLYLLNPAYSLSHNNANGLYVGVGTLSGGQITATYPVVAAHTSPSTTISEDKEWIAVDNSSSSYSGRLYVTWTHFTKSSDWINFSSSADHGQHWTVPVQVSPNSQNGAVQGSQVAVGPDGTIYLVWEAFYTGGQRRHWLATSSDGGGTFTSASAITPLFNELSFSSSYRKNSFAALAVSPNNGNVYVAYADQPNGTVGAEVELVLSSNRGAGFTSPVVINDNSAGQQFMPALAADSAGAVHASWFDTRNSLDAQSYDIAATYSQDNGATFAPNSRLTASLISAGSASFIGDYAGNAAGGGSAHPVWTSGGFNNGKLQTATLSLPPGTPDFTVSASPASQTVAPGNNTSYTVTVSALNGFSGVVSLSASGLPTGAAASFNPTSVTGSGTSTLTVTTDAATTPTGSYTVTLTGTSGTLQHSTTVTLVVPSSSTATTVSVVSIGYSTSGGKTGSKNLIVTLTLRDNLGNAVSGASVSINLFLNGAPFASGTGTTLSDGTASFAANNAPSGTYTTTVSGVTASGLTWDGVTPPNSFTK